MCTSKTKVTVGIESSTTTNTITTVARINGRPVLQPTCNRVPNLEKRNSIKKVTPKSLSPPSPPISPKSNSPRPLAIKRGSDNNGLNLSSEKISIPKIPLKTPTLERKKSKSFTYLYSTRFYPEFQMNLDHPLQSSANHESEFQLEPNNSYFEASNQFTIHGAPIRNVACSWVLGLNLVFTLHPQASKDTCNEIFLTLAMAELGTRKWWKRKDGE